MSQELSAHLTVDKFASLSQFVTFQTLSKAIDCVEFQKVLQDIGTADPGAHRFVLLIQD